MCIIKFWHVLLSHDTMPNDDVRKSSKLEPPHLPMMQLDPSHSLSVPTGLAEGRWPVRDPVSTPLYSWFYSHESSDIFREIWCRCWKY